MKEVTINKKTAMKVMKLIYRWTRAEIMARHGPFRCTDLSFIDFTHAKIEIEDEIRTLLFGESNLVTLGEAWGLLKDRETVARPSRKLGKKKKKKKKRR